MLDSPRGVSLAHSAARQFAAKDLSHRGNRLVHSYSRHALRLLLHPPRRDRFRRPRRTSLRMDRPRHGRNRRLRSLRASTASPGSRSHRSIIGAPRSASNSSASAKPQRVCPARSFALLGTLALGWLAWRLYGAETARWLLLLLPTTVGMIGFSHAAATDMPFAATLTCAMVRLQSCSVCVPCVDPRPNDESTFVLLASLVPSHYA